MSVKVLYLSCHEGLEYDEIKLFSQLSDIQIRSCGAYVDPTQCNSLRPSIPTLKKSPDSHVAASYKFNTEDHTLNDDLLGWADVVIYMHMPEWLHKSIEILDRYPKVQIVYRSIGQSSPSVESMLLNYTRHFGRRFHIVRYSPYEKHIQGFVKSPTTIRFAKAPEEFQGWTLDTSSDRFIMLAAQNGLGRGNFTHVRESIDVLKGLPLQLIGPSNQEAEALVPVVNPDYAGWKEILRRTNLLFYTGTVPASYTLTPIEAMMTGTPIISISGSMWANEHLGWCPAEALEVPDMVGAPFTVDSWSEARELVETVFNSPDILQEMSAQNRQTAIKLFDATKIGKQWQTFIHSISS